MIIMVVSSHGTNSIKWIIPTFAFFRDDRNIFISSTNKSLSTHRSFLSIARVFTLLQYGSNHFIMSNSHLTKLNLPFSGNAQGNVMPVVMLFIHQSISLFMYQTGYYLLRLLATAHIFYISLLGGHSQLVCSTSDDTRWTLAKRVVTTIVDQYCFSLQPKQLTINLLFLNKICIFQIILVWWYIYWQFALLAVLIDLGSNRLLTCKVVSDLILEVFFDCLKLIFILAYHNLDSSSSLLFRNNIIISNSVSTKDITVITYLTNLAKLCVI